MEQYGETAAIQRLKAVLAIEQTAAHFDLERARMWRSLAIVSMATTFGLLFFVLYLASRYGGQ